MVVIKLDAQTIVILHPHVDVLKKRQMDLHVKLGG